MSEMYDYWNEHHWDCLFRHSMIVQSNTPFEHIEERCEYDKTQGRDCDYSECPYRHQFERVQEALNESLDAIITRMEAGCK